MVSEGSEVSVKRVTTFAAFVLLGLAFLLDLFFSITVADKLIEVMEMLVIAGFGTTAIEKFAKPKKEEPKQEGEDPVIN